MICSHDLGPLKETLLISPTEEKLLQRVYDIIVSHVYIDSNGGIYYGIVFLTIMY
jgi:hypothetical protein